MDIEFSQIHEMVYMHDIVNSDSKKKPRIPLKKFLNAEKVSHANNIMGIKFKICEC